MIETNDEVIQTPEPIPVSETATVPAPRVKDPRGRKPLNFKELTEVSFEYNGVTYTIKKNEPNQKNMVKAPWSDKEFCRLYAKWWQRLKGKDQPRKNIPRKPKKFCQVCQSYYKSDVFHPASTKHQHILKCMELVRRQAVDYLSSCMITNSYDL